MATQFLPNFIVNSCCGGHSSAKPLLQKAIDKKIIWNNKEIRIDKKPVYFKITMNL